jgi:CRP/FNR family cyclic AMP-dependent transcriptional regulator
MEGPVAKRIKISFDPKAFLSKVMGGEPFPIIGRIKSSTGRANPRIPFSTFRAARSSRPSSPSTGRKVVALLGTGDFFGEGCLTGLPLRLATVSSMTECVIVRITKADTTRVIHEEPAFAELFIAHLLARNLRVEEDLVDQLFNSSEKRLARVLLLLANFGKEGRPEPILAKISQETLAWISTARIPPNARVA